MKSCIIVCGAPIKNYENIKKLLPADAFTIYCDCGLRHEAGLLLSPSLIVGDFDSYNNPNRNAETIVLPREKDDTDSVFAIREALKRGFDDITLLGAVGDRFDHSFGNIAILLWLDSLGKHARIIDDYSEIEVVSSSAEITDIYPFFSVLNIDGSPHGISIKNAKWELNDAEITPDYQYGVSNEPIPGKIAVVSVKEGRILLVKNRRLEDE